MGKVTTIRVCSDEEAAQAISNSNATGIPVVLVHPQGTQEFWVPGVGSIMVEQGASASQFRVIPIGGPQLALHEEGLRTLVGILIAMAEAASTDEEQ